MLEECPDYMLKGFWFSPIGCYAADHITAIQKALRKTWTFLASSLYPVKLSRNSFAFSLICIEGPSISGGSLCSGQRPVLMHVFSRTLFLSYSLLFWTLLTLQILISIAFRGVHRPPFIIWNPFVVPSRNAQLSANPFYSHLFWECFVRLLAPTVT